MQIKQGIPVSPGVAISQAVVIDAEDLPVPRRTVPGSQVAQELERLDRAIAESTKELERVREQASVSVGADVARLFTVHIGLLHDKSLVGEIRQMIQRERV